MFVYDNASAANGTNYTFAEIAAAFPSDVVSDSSTSRVGYRFKVSLQVGDSGAGTATTTLKDTSATVKFDTGKTLLYRATQTTSWFTEFGTKVGSGNQASGVSGIEITFGAATVLRGQQKWYGSIMRQTAGAVTVNTADDDGSEFVNCLWQSSATGTAPLPFGTSTTRASNIYNLDISHTTSAQVISNWGAVTAERLTISAAAPTAFFQTASPSVKIKDVVLIGTPTLSDVRFTSGAAVLWKFIKPKWSGATKLSATAAITIAADNGLAEAWVWDVKVVDRAGAGVASIPVKLTDALGNVVVNTTTNSDGRVSFGSGIEANAVTVLDHYLTNSVYLTRTRSPFTVKVNTSDLTGYNSNYLSRTYAFNWLGEPTQTYQDVGDIIAIQEPSGNPTAWIEASL